MSGAQRAPALDWVKAPECMQACTQTTVLSLSYHDEFMTCLEPLVPCPGHADLVVLCLSVHWSVPTQCHSTLTPLADSRTCWIGAGCWYNAGNDVQAILMLLLHLVMATLSLPPQSEQPLRETMMIESILHKTGVMICTSSTCMFLHPASSKPEHTHLNAHMSSALD